MFLSGDVNLLFSSLHRKGGSAAPLAPPHIRRWSSPMNSTTIDFSFNGSMIATAMKRNGRDVTPHPPLSTSSTTTNPNVNANQKLNLDSNHGQRQTSVLFVIKYDTKEDDILGFPWTNCSASRCQFWVHSGCAGIWFQTIEQLDAWVKDFFCRKHFLKMDVEIVEPP